MGLLSYHAVTARSRSPLTSGSNVNCRRLDIFRHAGVTGYEGRPLHFDRIGRHEAKRIVERGHDQRGGCLNPVAQLIERYLGLDLNIPAKATGLDRTFDRRDIVRTLVGTPLTAKN